MGACCGKDSDKLEEKPVKHEQPKPIPKKDVEPAAVDSQRSRTSSERNSRSGDRPDTRQPLPPPESSVKSSQKQEVSGKSSGASEIPQATPETMKSIDAQSGPDIPIAPPEMKKPIDAKCLDPLDTTTEEEAEGPGHLDPLSRAMCKLTADIYGKIKSENGVVFSPLSILVALGSAEMGASGDTRREILQLLSQNGLDTMECTKIYGALEQKILEILKTESQLRIANGIFREEILRVTESYYQNVMQLFKTEVMDAPFAADKEKARQEINQWVSKRTAGKITEMYQEGGVDPGWRCVLVNAIYMHIQFRVRKIKHNTFIGKKGVQQADFMCGTNAPYMGRGDFHAIELLYKGDIMSMFIILPRQRNGLKEIEKRVNYNFLMDVFTGTRALENIQVRVEIPKFTSMRFGKCMLPAFAELGFGNRDGMGRMSDDPRMKISDIKHEVFIEIHDRPGAAITSNETLPSPDPYVNFLADHPFLFAIVHKPTWSIIFMGKVDSIATETK